mmetsp:Transcript_5020/g.10970  ORF Transcript_5020/g.10970 Transcript_5020/m.10970 type:complete len:153 (+) Transcript_5020:78-536(+)
MKTSTAILFAAAAVSSVSAFSPVTTDGRSSKTTALSMSKGKIASIKNSINSLSAENFSTTLTEIEPFLKNEAGISVYKKSMKRIGNRAKALGVDVPEGYCKDAKATAKRREKQDAYCKARAEEAAEAADAAAEAAEAEAESAAEEEAAPAEE